MPEYTTPRDRTPDAYYGHDALVYDVKAIRKFVQSKALRFTSYYEDTKWGAYGASHRILTNLQVGGKPMADVLGIEGGSAHNLLQLMQILDFFGTRYTPSPVAQRVMAEARA